MISSLKKEKILMYAKSCSWRYSPPSVHIELTDNCYNQCVMCGHWKRKNKEEIPTEVMKNFITEWKGWGLETVCFSGGDPVAHPGIKEILEHCVESSIGYGLVTSGCIDENKIPFSLLRKAEWVRVSLDSVIQEEYKKVRGGSVTSEMVQKSIEEMVDNRVPVELGITVHYGNIDNIKKAFEYGNSLNLPMSARTVYSHSDESLRLSRSQTEKLKYLSKQHGVKLTTDYNPVGYEHCWAVKYQLFISSSGDVYPCCILAGDTEKDRKINFNFGNIKSDEALSIMHSATDFTEYRRGTEKICESNCIERLDAINVICEYAMNTKSFF